MVNTHKDTILVIDDSMLMGKLIEHTFEQEPVRVLLAGTAQEGVQMAQEHHPGIILLDVVLPRTDGFAVCRSIKANLETCAIPIIFITAQGDRESVVRGFEAGAVDYVPKPFHPVELRARVHSHLENGKMKSALRQVNLVLDKALMEHRHRIDTDPLTGAENRRSLIVRVEEQAAQAEPFSILLADLDDMGEIIERYGRLAADYALMTVAQLLGGMCSATDGLFRWSAEGFALLLSYTTLQEAAVRAEEMRAKVEDCCLHYHDHDFSCTMTMAVGQYDRGLTVGQNMELLDDALSSGKRSGRNCCNLLEPTSANGV